LDLAFVILVARHVHRWLVGSRSTQRIRRHLSEGPVVPWWLVLAMQGAFHQKVSMSRRKRKGAL